MSTMHALRSVAEDNKAQTHTVLRALSEDLTLIATQFDRYFGYMATS